MPSPFSSLVIRTFVSISRKSRKTIKANDKKEVIFRRNKIFYPIV